MKLYSIPGSNNCRKVEAVIDHLGLNIDIRYLGLTTGELFSDEYFSLNPNGKVPTLVDEDFILWESNAILQYLCDQSADEQLFPSESKSRADIARWQFWEVTHFNKALGTIAFETILKQQLMQEPANQALVDNATEDLIKYSAVLDKHMADREFVVSDHITLADYSITSFEAFKQALPFDWSSYPNLNQYFERMQVNLIGLQQYLKTCRSLHDLFNA